MTTEESPKGTFMRLRRYKGAVSKSMLSDEANVSIVAIGQLENGAVVSPPLNEEEIERLAKWYNVRPEYLKEKIKAIKEGTYWDGEPA